MVPNSLKKIRPWKSWTISFKRRIPCNSMFWARLLSTKMSDTQILDYFHNRHLRAFLGRVPLLNQHFSWGQTTLWFYGFLAKLARGMGPLRINMKEDFGHQDETQTIPRAKNSFLIHFPYQPYSFQGATCCFFSHGLGSFKPFASIQVSHDILLQDSSSAPSITFKSKTRLMVVAAMVRWTLGLGILRTFNLKSNLT